MAFEKEVLLLITASAFLIYLFATQDGEYVPIAERPQRQTFGRNVINYYGWKGPFFIDDFAEFEQAAINEVEDRKMKPLGSDEYTETFTNFGLIENPYQEVVPVKRPNFYISKDGKGCVVPKYNKNNKDMKRCHRLAKYQCRVPTYTSEHGWRNEYWNSTYKMQGPSDKGSLCSPPNWCNGDPGNYRQATNNNLDFPNNLKCNARSRYMDYCEPRDKVSPFCYATAMKMCLNGEID
jgi:hypothetical protein